ncbi:MAG: hypothetical protein ACKOZX_13890 [Gammaproteobacteria bacterium]
MMRGRLAARQSLWPALVLTGATLLLSGCVTNTVQQVREAATNLSANDSVVVLGRRSRPTSNETELDFVSCVGDNLDDGDQGIRTIPEQAFLDALFPWFEPRTAPVNSSDLPKLIQQPSLAARLAEIGLRYLIWIDGSTQRTEQSGSLSCSVTPGGGGCFGFLSWENDSSYEATIWDVHSGKSVGRVSSDAVGTSYMPAVILPVPIIAPVRSAACDTMSEQLKSFLQGEA